MENDNQDKIIKYCSIIVVILFAAILIIAISMIDFSPKNDSEQIAEVDKDITNSDVSNTTNNKSFENKTLEEVDEELTNTIDKELANTINELPDDIIDNENVENDDNSNNNPYANNSNPGLQSIIDEIEGKSGTKFEFVVRDKEIVGSPIEDNNEVYGKLELIYRFDDNDKYIGASLIYDLTDFTHEEYEIIKGVLKSYFVDKEFTEVSDRVFRMDIENDSYDVTKDQLISALQQISVVKYEQ